MIDPLLMLEKYTLKHLKFYIKAVDDLFTPYLELNCINLMELLKQKEGHLINSAKN